MADFNRYFGNGNEERSPSSLVVGKIGLWILHIVMFTFALYSGAHGINASLQYAGNSGFSKLAQIIGIVTIEAVLIGIYLSSLNGRITGASQTIVAGTVFSIGFILALSGIVADSQINSGAELTPAIGFYLSWGLPIAPGIMSLGALLIHVLSPESLRYRKEDQQKRDLNELEFEARLGLERARAEEELSKKGLQLLSRKAVFRELENIYQSAEFREAIKRTAIERAPELFSEAGILIDHVMIPGNSEPISNPAPISIAGYKREPETVISPNGNGNGKRDFLH